MAGTPHNLSLIIVINKVGGTVGSTGLKGDWDYYRVVFFYCALRQNLSTPIPEGHCPAEV